LEEDGLDIVIAFAFVRDRPVHERVILQDKERECDGSIHWERGKVQEREWLSEMQSATQSEWLSAKPWDLESESGQASGLAPVAY